MLLKLVGCLCISFSVLGVRSQRAWGSSNGGYNSGFSNFWNSNGGFYNNNNKLSTGNVNNGRTWGPKSPAFGGRPNEEPNSFPSEKNWGYETSSNSDKNSGWVQSKPPGVNSGTSAGWQAESSRRPNDKKISSVTNEGGYLNSNSIQSSEDNNSGFSSWEYNDAKANSAKSSSQNSKPERDWYSNNFNSYNINSNAPNDNEIIDDSDYEDKWNSSSWGSNNNKKKKPNSNTSGGSGNWESTTQKTNKNSGTSRWETSNNKKPHKPSGTKAWDSNDSSQPGREIHATNTNGQTEKMPSTAHISILDELDKNDWYFGKESNYPNPPFESTLNIDVSELWNFSKNKKFNQNSRGNSGRNNNNNNSNNNNNNNNNNQSNFKLDNNNYKNNNKRNYSSNNNNNGNNNRRRNREAEAEEAVSIQCECVPINMCEEEDMVITQEDIKFDLRPLQEFRCEKLTEVCCTNPKMKLANRGNFNKKKKQLRCGQRRLGKNPFAGLGEDIAQPGEFPWNLRLEDEKINCSASLIHHKMALTAAHCVIGAQPDGLALKAGIWSSNNEPSQSRKIIKIIPHPDYNSRNPRNDIALLILETPFELTENVNTICLPVTNDKWDSNQCEVAGWRPEEIHGQIFEVLEKGVVNFLPQPECQNIMLVTDLWRNYILHDSFVCGLKKTGRKSCTGDEGGFVVCPSKKTPDAYIQIGIISKGLNCDEFGRPGIFTNILKFLDWINKKYIELGLFDDTDIRSLRTLD